MMVIMRTHCSAAAGDFNFFDHRISLQFPGFCHRTILKPEISLINLEKRIVVILYADTIENVILLYFTPSFQRVYFIVNKSIDLQREMTKLITNSYYRSVKCDPRYSLGLIRTN